MWVSAGLFLLWFGGCTFLCASSLQCHECSDSFKRVWSPTLCQGNASHTPSRVCSQGQDYCFVERVTVKGIVTRITRDCTSSCEYGCQASAFGLTHITCTSCCNTDNCNIDDTGVPYFDGKRVWFTVSTCLLVFGAIVL